MSEQAVLAAQEADPDVRALRERIVALEKVLGEFVGTDYWVVNSTWCSPVAWADLVEKARHLLGIEET